MSVFDDKKCLKAYVQIGLEAEVLPVVNMNVKVCPKPDKAEFKSTRKLLSDWSKHFMDPNSCEDISVMRKLLISGSEFKIDELSDLEIVKVRPYILHARVCTHIKSLLNEEQVKYSFIIVN